MAQIARFLLLEGDGYLLQEDGQSRLILYYEEVADGWPAFIDFRNKTSPATFRDKRSLAAFRDKAAMAKFRDKRAVVDSGNN